MLALACLLHVMDLTVLHLAVPALSAGLQPTSAQLLWIIGVYGFMVAGALVTMGTLGDRSVAVAIYRAGLADLPGVPAADAARDTLGGAVAAAGQLPGPAGDTLLDAAQGSFVAGLQLTSLIAAVIAAAIAVVAAVALRGPTPATAEEREPAVCPA